MPSLSSKVEVRVVVSRFAGPEAPGVQVNVQEKVLPCETVTVDGQVIGLNLPRLEGGGGRPQKAVSRPMAVIGEEPVVLMLVWPVTVR